MKQNDFFWIHLFRREYFCLFFFFFILLLNYQYFHILLYYFVVPILKWFFSFFQNNSLFLIFSFEELYPFKLLNFYFQSSNFLILHSKIFFKKDFKIEILIFIWVPKTSQCHHEILKGNLFLEIKSQNLHQFFH